MNEKTALDRAEGLGHGYRIERMELPLGNTRIHAYMYLADPAYSDPTRLPYAWYKDLVVVGAQFHSFPSEYISELEAHPTQADPNSARSALQQEAAFTTRRLRDTRAAPN